MPCLLALVALFVPRLVIVLVVIFSDYIGRAYDGILWPLLGFFFAPVTTLAYAWAVNEHGGLNSVFTWVVFIIAILFDLGSSGESERQRRRRSD